MTMERRARLFRRAGDEMAKDRKMLGQHRLDLGRVMMALKNVVRGEQRQLAPSDRLAQARIRAAQDRIDMEIALEALQFRRRPLTLLKIPDSRLLLLKVGALQMRKGLIKRHGFEQPAQFEMLAHQVRRQRPDVPAPIAVLRDEADTIELSDDFVRHRPADAIMLGEQALVEQKPAIGQM